MWTVPLKNQYGVNATTPVYGSGSVFYATAYTPAVLYRLQPSNAGVAAEQAWSNPLESVTGGAVLAGDRLYAGGYKKTRWWFCLDWRTGETRCEQKGVVSGAATYADGRLYCLNEDGSAALLRPTPDSLEIAGRFRLVPKRVGDAWAHPVLLHGRLYLRYHDTLWCHDVGQVANLPGLKAD